MFSRQMSLPGWASLHQERLVLSAVLVAGVVGIGGVAGTVSLDVVGKTVDPGSFRVARSAGFESSDADGFFSRRPFQGPGSRQQASGAGSGS